MDLFDKVREKEQFKEDEREGLSLSDNPITNIIEGGNELIDLHTLLKRIRFTIDLLENNTEICDKHYDEYIHSLISDATAVNQLRNAYCKHHKGGI